VALRFKALWRRLGPGLDGGGTFADADAWYATLQGTAEPAVAEAQARALTDLLASYAITGQREILLSVDEFSSVSRRLPIWRLYERARPALPPSRADHRRPESATTEPLPRIQPAIESPQPAAHPEAVQRSQDTSEVFSQALGKPWA
jgi:hypothetical protein